MKQSIRLFIYKYLNGYEKGTIKCLDDMLVTYEDEPSILNSFSDKQLSVLNSLEEKGVLEEYLRILQEYYTQRKNANLTQDDIIVKANIKGTGKRDKMSCTGGRYSLF